MPDLVKMAQDQLAARMHELAPAVEEAARLEQALAQADAGAHRLSRRARQALDMVIAEPGRTTGEIASSMRASRATLYVVLPRLADAGLVTKRWHRWYPTEQAELEREARWHAERIARRARRSA